MQKNIYKKILICYGTRPEIIKLSPIIKLLIKRNLSDFDKQLAIAKQVKENYFEPVSTRNVKFFLVRIFLYT